MADLSQLATLMQKQSAHPNPASFQSGMDAAYARNMLKQLMQAQMESAQADNQYKKTQGDQLLQQILASQTKLPHEVRKIQSEEEENLAQAGKYKADKTKTDEETSTIQNNRMVASVVTGLQNGNVDLNGLAVLADRGVVDKSLIIDYFNTKGKGPKAIAEARKRIESSLMNNLEHLRAKDLQSQKDAADYARTSLTAGTQQDVATDSKEKGAIRREISQWSAKTGQPANKHPKFSLLAEGLPKQEGAQSFENQGELAKLKAQLELYADEPDTHRGKRALKKRIEILEGRAPAPQTNSTNKANPLYDKYSNYLKD